MKTTKTILKIKDEWLVASDVIKGLSDMSPLESIEIPLEWYEQIRELFKFVFVFPLRLILSPVYGFMDAIREVMDELNSQ